jgi:hypothetical protein
VCVGVWVGVVQTSILQASVAAMAMAAASADTQPGTVHRRTHSFTGSHPQVALAPHDSLGSMDSDASAPDLSAIDDDDMLGTGPWGP